MGAIYTQATFLQNYQQADVEKAKVWRQALDNSSARLAQTLLNYKDANGNPLPVSSLDLGALAQQNALPDSVAGGFSLFVQAFQEAPLAQVSDAPVLAAMNTASEQYNKIDACGADWNDAVQAYNTERNKIPGDVVGRIAEALHVKTLPETLPYYAGSYNGSISQPKPEAPKGAEKMQMSADGAMVPLLHGQWAEVRTLVIGEVQPAVQEKEEWVVHTRNLSYFSRKTSSDGRTTTSNSPFRCRWGR
jgi:hypothetical protein